jgi:hypothetical protein
LSVRLESESLPWPWCLCSDSNWKQTLIPSSSTFSRWTLKHPLLLPTLPTSVAM